MSQTNKENNDIAFLNTIRKHTILTILYIIFVNILILMVNIIVKIISIGYNIISNKTYSHESLQEFSDDIIRESIKQIDKMETNKDINVKKCNFKYQCVSLGGGGYKVTQYIGYILYALKYDLIDDNTQFIGSSLGSCCAVIAIILYNQYKYNNKTINDTMIHLLSQTILHSIYARLNFFHLPLIGNWWSIWEKNTLIPMLYNDVINIKMFNNDKLHIISTKLFPYPTKVTFNKFKSIKQLIQYLSFSCMIPFWSFSYPFLYFNGNCYVDGGFVDLIPNGLSTNICKNIIIYNYSANTKRTFFPLKTKQDYINDIITGYIKCKEITTNNCETLGLF